jgi:5-methylthioadenosine/S-adenosylhomocysteine deaminase
VHLDDDEVDIIARTDTAVVACPWAYLRLAQGVTVAGRHGTLFQLGVRLALGCDAENAGDAVDILRAAALFVGIERDRLMDAFAITAQHGLELATVRGAEAIGKAAQLGSLEVGKQADIVVHSTRGPQWLPISTDPVRQLIWASDGRSVSDVLVAGRHVVRDGACVSVDVDSFREEAIARRNHFLNLRRS